MVGGGDEGSGAGGSHRDGGLVGLDVNDALDGDLVGLEFLDDVNQMRADGRKSGGLSDGFRNGNHIEGEHGRPAGVALKNSVAGVTDGGVDGEDSHGLEWGNEAFLGGERFLIHVEGEKMGSTDKFSSGDVENIKPAMAAREGMGGGELVSFGEDI